MRTSHAFALSTSGRKHSRNEDAYAADDTLGIYAVADGVSGGRNGEVAAATAIDAAYAFATEALAVLRRPVRPEDLAHVARQAVEHAAQAVNEIARADGSHAGAATTLTLLLVDGGQAAMAHVGDSRLYLVRDAHVEQLSVDHTVANDLLRAGYIGPEQSRRHSLRDVLSRALGPHRAVLVDTLQLHVAPRDTIMLATDGLEPVIDERTVVDQVARSDDVAAGAKRLVQRAEELGVQGDTTVVLVRIDDAADDPYATAAELLSGVDALAGLDLASRSRIVGAGTVDLLEAGGIVLHEGQPFGGLWLVVEGTLHWGGGTPVELVRGDWYGESALVTEVRAPVDITAKTAAKVFYLPAEKWSRLARRRPMLGVSVLTRLAAVAARHAAVLPHRPKI